MNTSVDSNTTLLSSFSKFDLNPSIDIIYTATYSINLILGVPTNVYVLWLIVTGAGGLLASDFFALNLTVSEILFYVNCLLTIICKYFQMNGAFRIVSSFCLGFVNTGRPLFQCCVCVERYLAVVHPVIFLKYKPLRYRVGCSGLVWLMVLGSCFVYMYMLAKSPVVISYITLGFSLVVFSVKLFCGLAVLRALKRPGPGEREREGTNNMKTRAFRIILIIMVSMLIHYLTMIVAITLQNILEASKLGLALSICLSISVVSGFVHPLLYLHRAGKLPCIRGP